MKHETHDPSTLSRRPLSAFQSLAWLTPPHSAGNNTDLNITVILNPCSGPCVNGRPEQVYLDEMPKLKNYPNIRSLGYVATNYTNRPIEDVMLEIRTYADWPRILNDTRVGVDGIFFDETPGVYDWRWYDYLSILKDEVKMSQGLGEKVVGELYPTSLYRIPITHFHLIVLSRNARQHGKPLGSEYYQSFCYPTIIPYISIFLQSVSSDTHSYQFLLEFYAFPNPVSC